MKKNLFFAALVAVAAIFASCESKQPTAVLPENMNDSVLVTGYIRVAVAGTGTTKIDVVDEGTEVTVLRGTKVDGSIAYQKYIVKTDKDGFYQISLGCAAGKTIDEVRVDCGFYSDDDHATLDEDFKPTTSEGYVFGSNSITNCLAGRAYGIDVTCSIVDYVDKPGLNN